MLQVVDLRLREAKQMRAELRTAMNETVRGAYRSFINRVEEQVQRYQIALDHTWMLGMSAVARAVDEKVSPGSGHVTILVENVIDRLEAIGSYGYLVTAADIGFERALTDLQTRGWLRSFQQPTHAPSAIFEPILKANQDYLHTSLYPDLLKQVQSGRNVGEITQAMRARVDLYAHYAWTASEMAYKLAMQQFFAKARPKLKVRESFREGGSGSGNFDHAGRPGEVGGSVGDSGAMKPTEKQRTLLRQIIVGGVTSGRPGSVSVNIAANRVLGNPDMFGMPQKQLDEYKKNGHLQPDNFNMDAIATEATEDMQAVHAYAAQEWDKTFPNGSRVYRGIDPAEADALSNVKQGDTFTMRPIVSTSETLATAQQFGMGDRTYDGSRRDCNVIQIDDVRGNNVIGYQALYPAQYTYKGESEVTLFGAQKFRLQSIETMHEGYSRLNMRTFHVVPV